jgi:hypothetical protein
MESLKKILPCTYDFLPKPKAAAFDQFYWPLQTKLGVRQLGKAK